MTVNKWIKNRIFAIAILLSIIFSSGYSSYAATAFVNQNDYTYAGSIKQEAKRVKSECLCPEKNAQIQIKRTVDGTSKEAKLRMKINENKSNINDLYKEIGKKVYEKHVRQENIDIKADLEEECAKIDILSSEIESCLTSILELKDKKQCIKCHAEIDENAVFCPKCGEKQPEIEVKEAEVVTEDLENSDVKPENATEAEIVEEKVSGEDNTEREKASEESNSDQQ